MTPLINTNKSKKLQDASCDIEFQNKDVHSTYQPTHVNLVLSEFKCFGFGENHFENESISKLNPDVCFSYEYRCLNK